MKTNWLYIGIIIGLCFMVLQFWDRAPKLLLPEDEAQRERKIFPYAVIEQAHSKHFDRQGELSYEFVAEKLRHFRIKLDTISENDYTLIDTIKVTLHTEDSPWIVTADQGRLSDAGTTLTLSSNVRIWQTLATGGATELVTEELVIYPQEKIITTAAAVKITAPTGQLEAEGMTVDLERQHIQLKNNVRGFHEPI